MKSAFSHADSADRRVNPNYPDWLTGRSDGGNRACAASLYFFQELIGPDGLHKVPNLRFGTFQVRPGVVHPAHHHPAPEIYFILEGAARWYVEDEQAEVTAGSVIYHRPMAAHGLETTGDSALRACWIWWEPSDSSATPEVLNTPSRLVRPDRDELRERAKPFRR